TRLARQAAPRRKLRSHQPRRPRQNQPPTRNAPTVPVIRLLPAIGERHRRGMRIRFQKPPEGQPWAAWEVDRGRRRIVRGGMGWAPHWRLTHDLAGYAVERSLDLTSGFGHCIADGATFASTDRKLTRPGRAVIATRRAALEEHDKLTHG